MIEGDEDVGNEGLKWRIEGVGVGLGIEVVNEIG